MGTWKKLRRESGTGAFKELKRESGTGGWKALYWDYEDFTTFTEVDVAADRIQKTAYHIDHESYRNSDTYLYKDYGVGHFGDFTHKIKIKGTQNADQAWGACWVLANDLNDVKGLTDSNKTYIHVHLYYSAGNFSVVLREGYGGAYYQDNNVNGFSSGDWIYPRIVKSGTTFTCYLYSDSDYSSLVDTLSLTLHANHTFRYLYGCNVWNDGLNKYLTIDIENFDIGE